MLNCARFQRGAWLRVVSRREAQEVPVMEELRAFILPSLTDAGGVDATGHKPPQDEDRELWLIWDATGKSPGSTATVR